METPGSARDNWTRKGRAGPAGIGLALQGGGAHGAFTWGVLDRLIEEEWLNIDGISGTSAGAMNAAVLASGLAKSGKDGAGQALERFWRGVSDAHAVDAGQRSSLDLEPLLKGI